MPGSDLPTVVVASLIRTMLLYAVLIWAVLRREVVAAPIARSAG